MRTPKQAAAVFLTSVVLVMLGVSTTFAPPAWWTQRQVIATGATADNYAPANLGQAKWMATQALAEMNDKLAPVGGAGFLITDLFPAPPPAQGQSGYNAATRQAYADAQYAPLNIGQLKNLSYRFYNRLKAIGYTAAPMNASNPQGYPWTAATSDDDNYAPANLGQLKNIFSFDLSSFSLTNVDADQDGLADVYEVAHGLNPFAVSTAGDAFTDGWKIAHGLDATRKMIADNAAGTVLGLKVFTPLH